MAPKKMAPKKSISKCKLIGGLILSQVWKYAASKSADGTINFGTFMKKDEGDVGTLLAWVPFLTACLFHMY